jgi:hypothetical protein
MPVPGTGPEPVRFTFPKEDGAIGESGVSPPKKFPDRLQQFSKIWVNIGEYLKKVHRHDRVLSKISQKFLSV